MSILDEAKNRIDGQITTATSEAPQGSREMTTQVDELNGRLDQLTEDPGAAIEAEAEQALTEVKDQAEEKVKAEADKLVDRAKNEAIEKGTELAPEAMNYAGKLAEPVSHVNPAKVEHYARDIKRELGETIGPEDAADPNAAVAKAGRQSDLGYDNFNNATGGALSAVDAALGDGAGRETFDVIGTVYEVNKVFLAGTVWGMVLSAYNLVKDGGIKKAVKALGNLGRRAWGGVKAVGSAFKKGWEAAGNAVKKGWGAITGIFGSVPRPPDRRKLDSDRDGLSDHDEGVLGTDPRARDTDRDGIDDRDEVRTGLDPNNADTDGDGLNDGVEVNRYHTDPLSYTTLDEIPLAAFDRPKRAVAAPKRAVAAPKQGIAGIGRRWRAGIVAGVIAIGGLVAVGVASGGVGVATSTKSRPDAPAVTQSGPSGAQDGRTGSGGFDGVVSDAQSAGGSSVVDRNSRPPSAAADVSAGQVPPAATGAGAEPAAPAAPPAGPPSAATPAQPAPPAAGPPSAATPAPAVPTPATSQPGPDPDDAVDFGNCDCGSYYPPVR